MRFWTIFLCMTNRFGVLLHPDDVRWAAAEGVCENVIAAVLLLHERSADEIVPALPRRRTRASDQIRWAISKRLSARHARGAQTVEDIDIATAAEQQRRERPSGQRASQAEHRRPSPQSITRPAKRRDTRLPPGLGAGGHSPQSINGTGSHQPADCSGSCSVAGAVGILFATY